MNELVKFFKDVFMLNESDNELKIGLAQFKTEDTAQKTVKKEEKITKEVKLSDLMRRSA